MPMDTSKRSKSSRKRKLRTDDAIDIILGRSKYIEPRSEAHVKDEEDLGIVVPLNIDPVKIEEKMRPELEVVERVPAKRRKVRFATTPVCHQQGGRRASVQRQAPQLAAAHRPSRRVDEAEARHPRPARQPEPQEIGIWHRKSANSWQQKLESRLEASLEEAERLSKVVSRLLSDAEWIDEEIKSIRAGINALRNSQTLCRCGCPAESCR